MKFSEKWLREWVNPTISTQELSEQLSMAGLEVDAIESVAEDFSGVVVGHVVQCEQHPNADKLRVTKVDVGEPELLDIVCGAPNCKKNMKVAVAKVGAVLPGNFKIKKAKLRGESSFGMLCSFSELGMGDDHSGIIELPNDANLGDDLRDYLHLDDQTIEIDLTPNRADCLGIKGIAREVGVLNQTDVTEPNVELVSVDVEDKRQIVLDEPKCCPRYLGRVIRNVDLTQPSPLWLQEKLRRSGIRSIDPVVDVTNFVLLELGHPMHAFDNDTLKGNIHVRYANDNENLILLDESEVSIKPSTLVIADEEKPLALAGIFGGLKSGVNASTKNIFLESAFFTPDAILGKARQYGLHTDASHRYERGVDPHLQETAMERATQLLVSIVGGKVGPITQGVSEHHLPTSKTLTLRHSRLSRVLGISIDLVRVTDIFTRLGLTPKLENETWKVTVPPYRFDISIEEDLIEEVARVYGYNNIPNVAPQSKLLMRDASENNINPNRFKNLLTSLGYQEAITYSFVDPKLQALMFPDIDGLTLPNPISTDMSVMRVSLLPGLLACMSYNQKRQQNNVRLFEQGLRFVPDKTEKTGVRQETMLTGVISGNVCSEHWAMDSTPLDFYDAKAHVESLLQLLVDTSTIDFRKDQHPSMHPGQTAGIYLDEILVGYVGSIHPKLQKPVGLAGKTFAFELEMVNISKRALPEASNISKYPGNRRDIAVTVTKDVEIGRILNSIEKLGIDDLVDLNLFDVYEGEGIEPGFKSLAFSMWLQHPERTLEDAEIQASVDLVIKLLEQQFDASLRD